MEGKNSIFFSLAVSGDFQVVGTIWELNRLELKTFDNRQEVLTYKKDKDESKENI